MARSGPVIRATLVAALDEVALLDERLDLDLRVQRAEDGVDHREPADDAGLPDHDLRASEQVGVDDRVRRHVALADVLGERRVGEPLERVGGYSHVSRAGSEPGRRTTWRSKTIALEREVGAEVRAARLLAHKRGLRDQPREQV